MYIAAAAAAAAAVGGTSPGSVPSGTPRGRRGGTEVTGGSGGGFIDPSSTVTGDFFTPGYYPTPNAYGPSSYSSTSSNAYRPHYHTVGGNLTASYYPGMYNQLEEALPYAHSVTFGSTDDVKKVNAGSSATTSTNASTD